VACVPSIHAFWPAAVIAVGVRSPLWGVDTHAKRHSTRCSNVVTHRRSTRRARTSLTSESERDLVRSRWYDRAYLIGLHAILDTWWST
jgi:hypothetical protein